MTDRSESEHNDREPGGRNNLFERFPTEERDRVRQVWALSAEAATERPDIDMSDREIDEALTGVHSRLGFLDFPVWRWAAAAAITLLIAVLAALIIPHSVTAPYGEMTTVTLSDGSTVELNSGSELQYSRLFAFSNRSVTLDGEAFFSVRQGEHPFVVNANGSTVRVTGTKFNIRSWSTDPGAETEVAVTEGTVSFYPSGLPENLVTISTGRLSRLTVEMNQPSTPEPVTLDRITGWRTDELIFNKRSLPVIFRELERRFDVTIRLEIEGLEDETLTTYYAKKPTPETVLKDICRVKGLRFAETANGYRVYK